MESIFVIYILVLVIGLCVIFAILGIHSHTKQMTESLKSINEKLSRIDRSLKK